MQGGILSPNFIQLVCVNELSMQLRACNTGRMTGEMLVNHLMYADDLVIMSPSSAGLQQLHNICTEYGLKYDIKYNDSKSAVLICRTKQVKRLNFPALKLSGNILGSLYVGGLNTLDIL